MTTTTILPRPNKAACDYIMNLFDPNDLIAVMLLRDGEAPVHRFAKAEEVASAAFMEALAAQNGAGFNIYVCMNPLSANRRIKANIATIRTVYIDIDKDGEAARAKVNASTLVPKPQFILQSSPGKYQMIWVVENMAPAEQELLLDLLIHEFGGDPAASDMVRVLRLPGFANHKYVEKPQVSLVETHYAAPYGRGVFKLTAHTNGNGFKPPYKLPETIPDGSRNSELFKFASSMRAKGSEETEILAAAIAVNGRCTPPLPAEEVETIVRSVMKYPAGQLSHQAIIGTAVPHAEIPTENETIQVQSRETTEHNSDAAIPDMSDTVLDGRLGEIYQRRLSPTRNECGFPISYAWTALTTVAGVMVPRIEGGLIVEAPRTNLYVVQIGPIHSGKSVAINRAVSVLGLPGLLYSDLKAGSAEGLLQKLNKEFDKGKRTNRLLQDLDEWKHYFRKADIDNSSFMTILNSGFYKDRYNLVIADGKEIDFNCSISWIGGVVQEEYGTVIGAAATGGFYDRLYQGVCPSGFSFSYFPYEGMPEEITPQPVKIDGSVWEVVRDWRKADPSIGRAAEVAIRVAHICASYDGRPVLRGEDLGPAKALLDEQLKVRKLFAPDVGETLDAKCQSVIMGWMRKVAPAGEWVDIRDLQRGISYDRFGAVMFNRCLQALGSQFGGELDITTVKAATGAHAGGRPKAVVRLSL